MNNICKKTAYFVGRCLSGLHTRYRNFIVRKNRINYWTKLTENRLTNLPKNKLTSTELEEIGKFYRQYFSVNPSFHEFYKAATGKFDVRNIPDDVYYSQIDPYFNDWNLGVNMDNKVLYKIFFHDVAQPELICYRQNNIWFSGCGEPISLSDVPSLIREKGLSFIKKATGSMGGHGISVIENYVSEDDINNEISKFDGDLIIQKGLKQSRVISRINDSSVNTIRIMTFLRKDGTVKICSSCMRMGLKGSRVDNASSGGITIGIDNNGFLREKAFAPSGKSYHFHPTSKIEFKGIRIPNFNEVKELVKSLAIRFPQFRLISWDIALDENDSPVLIETNLFVGELEFHQLNNGPIFGDETKEILDEIYENPKEISYPF